MLELTGVRRLIYRTRVSIAVRSTALCRCLKRVHEVFSVCLMPHEQVNSDFYRAFSTKNISLMGTVWHNSPHVQCIHPGAKPLVGYENIVSMWSNMFLVRIVIWM